MFCAPHLAGTGHLESDHIGGFARSDHKSGLQRSVTALMTPRNGAGLLAVTVAGQFRERLAASRSALPGGTDDEVGQVVAESGWRLAVVVTAGRLGSVGSYGGAGA